MFRVSDSGSIFLQCFDTCGVCFLMFDEGVEFFRNRKYFVKGVIIFRCDQVFHVVPIGFSTQISVYVIFQGKTGVFL